MESILAIHGSVLICGEKVYFAAGRNAYVDAGVTVYALELSTGNVLQQRRYYLERQEHKTLLTKHAHEADGFKNGILSSDGERIFIHATSLSEDFSDRDTGDTKFGTGNRNNLTTFNSLLDETITKRSRWMLPKTGAAGQMLCFDDQTIYGANMVKRYQFLTYTNHFTPGQGGFFLYGYKGNRNKELWQAQHPLIVTAMAATGAHVYFAGMPDEIDADDPLLNYEGRGKGLLMILNKRTGDLESTITLPAAVAFNGIAVTGQELLVSLKNGTLMRLVP